MVGALALVVVAAVALLRMFSTLREQPSTGGEILPLVSMPGQQDTPAISPDGSQVAFAYSGGTAPRHLYRPDRRRKTFATYRGKGDANPAWSPDGRQIAFARFSNSSDQKKLYVIPALWRVGTSAVTTSYPKSAQVQPDELVA